MTSILEIILAAAMFIGSWGFSFGYTFDDACFERDFFIQRQVGAQETCVIHIYEDGTAQWIMDDEISNGQWTNEDGLEEYRLSFPEMGMAFTMEIEQSTWDCADEGMLVLTENQPGGARTWNFSRVWRCSQCSLYSTEESNYCAGCGAARPAE